MEITELRLHPDAAFVPVSSDRVQLRSPDGKHITFFDENRGVSAVLKAFLSGVDQTALQGLKDDFSSEFIDGIMDPLQQRGLLKSKDDWKAFDQYTRLKDAYLAQGGMVKNVTLPDRVWVRGDGEIATRLRQIFAADMATPEAAQDQRTLVIVASDNEDAQTLQDFNRDLVKARQLGTFMRWRTNEFVVGPFIVPSETGCFDCERHRAMASALHPAEAEAVLEHGNGPSYEGGRVLDSMLRALAERHVNAILSGAWCLAAPGCVARHNPVTLETASSSILRLPRCPTCGSKDTRLPKRAIRDLT